MRAWLTRILGWHLQTILIVSFALVAAITVGLNALVISRVINQYLAQAQDARVQRDMDLAKAFYQEKLNEISAVGQRMSKDPAILDTLAAISEEKPGALETIENEITRKVTVPTLDGTFLIAVLDADGEIVTARAISAEGEILQASNSGNWSELPIVQTALSSRQVQEATEVIPAEYLESIGLADQARITLIDTPLANKELFDGLEGSAGLALTGAYPLLAEQGDVVGIVITAFLFNNDFTLVDHIKEVAGIDTATIFFGDLRVSTNVPDESGRRAVGTRVSQDVYDIVLQDGQDYKGEAFVVKEPFITRYTPLRDHSGGVVGMLYVGARLSAFENLVNTINQRVILIALFSIVIAGVIAVPIARFITQPITVLVDANQRMAKGDLSVRVPENGQGELALLNRSFNSMAAELERTQNQLLQKEKLASVGQLAAGVAHEINNPLASILLFSDMMYRETPEGDRHRNDLKMIIDETTRCKRIVSDLLNFSRQQEMLTQRVDLNDLLDQTIDEIELLSNFEGITILRDFEPDLASLQADPNQLKQVFINLLNNAAESIEDEGVIEVSTRQVDPAWFEIKFSDSGCGIPRENLGKMFTPFFTTKGVGKGTGLGLSITYGIIKMHRGQISVESELGIGSSFTIRLPIRSEPAETGSNSNSNLIG